MKKLFEQIKEGVPWEKKPREANREKRVLVIGDTHEPFCKEGYLEFCSNTAKRFKCNEFVHVGDEIDSHAISYHESDPDGYSASDELEQAQEKLKNWFEAFPKMKVCIGNHTRLHKRRAKSIGLPSKYIKDYNELWNAPKGWKWSYEWEIDDVLYQHGTGSSGKYPHVTRAGDNRQSTVIGHCHSVSGVKYLVSRKDRIFGMAVGCGIDRHTYAMSYGKDFAKKPAISCGVVLGGVTAFVVPMELN